MKSLRPIPYDFIVSKGNHMVGLKTERIAKEGAEVFKV